MKIVATLWSLHTSGSNIRMRVIDNYIFSNQLIILIKLKWLSKTARKKRKNSQINKRTSRLKLTLIVLSRLVRMTISIFDTTSVIKVSLATSFWSSRSRPRKVD